MSIRKKFLQKNITIIATVLLFVILFAIGSFRYNGFFSLQVFLNLFIDNAHLIIVSTGIAFVIIGGGIDLSVGAMVAFTTMITGQLLKTGTNAYITILMALGIGLIFGTIQGLLITRFNLHPWIVTLGGMFFARGACYLIQTESIVITEETFSHISKFKIQMGGGYISIGVVVALVIVALFIFISKYTQFGRNVYAIGGNPKSALLMGLPVKRVRVMTYSLSGLCASIGGVVFALYMLSGYALHCNGMEMEAIAANVIGGILLTGGYGFLIGPMLGVLSTGVIQTLIIFQGTLSSWWTKIAVGALLFGFILLQRFIVLQNDRNKSIISRNIKKDKIKKEILQG